MTRARDLPLPPERSTLEPLRDVIPLGPRVLFVGINPGIRSATTGHHFAGYSNRFWKLLHESGLVPEPVTAVDDVRLPDWGYGVTNLVARPSPGIDTLKPAEYQLGRAALERKIRRARPGVVALVGVTLYRSLLARAGARTASAGARTASGGELASPLGLREEQLAGAPVFVLPNPSGRNANYSYAEMLAAFRALAAYVRDQSSRPSMATGSTGSSRSKPRTRA